MHAKHALLITTTEHIPLLAGVACSDYDQWDTLHVRPVKRRGCVPIPDMTGRMTLWSAMDRTFRPFRWMQRSASRRARLPDSESLEVCPCIIAARFHHLLMQAPEHESQPL